MCERLIGCLTEIPLLVYLFDLSVFIYLFTMQGPDAGGHAAVGGAEAGAGPGAAEEQEAGGVHEEAGRRDEAHRRAALPDDSQTGR